MFWENSIETSILSRVKQITGPGWMHETSARTWCTGRPRGIGWRGRWEQGSGWGIHVNPWLIHVNVWQKSLQNCKVISLQLIKNKWGKKITHDAFFAIEPFSWQRGFIPPSFTASFFYFSLFKLGGDHRGRCDTWISFVHIRFEDDQRFISPSSWYWNCYLFLDVKFSFFNFNFILTHSWLTALC